MPPSTATPNRYPTLSTVTQRMIALGVPCANDEVRIMASLRDREHLVRALDAASSNAKAKEYLNKALAEARAKAGGGTKTESPLQKEGARLEDVPMPSDAMAPPARAGSPATRIAPRAPAPSATPSVIGRVSSIADRIPPHRASGSAAAPHAAGAASTTTAADEHPLGAAPSAQQRAPAPATTGAGDARQYDQHAAYGKDTAVQFDRSPTPDRKSYTVNISMAKAKPGTACTEGVLWNQAIRIMLTAHEIQLVAAVMLGYLTKVRFAGHGQQNDKWFEVIENSAQYAGSIKFTLAQGKDASRDIRSVNVGAPDIGKALGVFLRAAHDQLNLEDALLLAAIRRTADLHAKRDAARESSGASRHN